MKNLLNRQEEVLELIKLEAYSFCPDLIDETVQHHETEISYRSGFIRLSFHVRVSIKYIYQSTYNDPQYEPDYEIILTDYNVELYDADGHNIDHDIYSILIKEALAPVEHY